MVLRNFPSLQRPLSTPLAQPQQIKFLMVVNKPLRILHFNDVYHLLPQPKNEPVGGISRFYTLLNQLRQLPGKPLVLFSGDLFNPSIESSATKGAHMIKPFSKLGVDVACFGNHVSFLLRLE